MKVCAVTLGSRGDILPFILLEKYLKSNTHGQTEYPVEMTIVTTDCYKTWIESEGIQFKSLAPFEKDVDKIMSRADVAESVANANAIEFLRLIQEKPENEALILDQIKQSCEGADFILASQLVAPKCAIIGETLGIPVGVWYSYPNHVTKEFPNALISGMMPSLPSWSPLNRLTYSLVHHGGWKQEGSNINNWRKENGLPLIESASHYQSWLEALPSLYSYSPYLLPRPKDWPEHAVVGGFIVDTEKSELAGELLQFINDSHEEGAQVIYLGFGSMPVTTSRTFRPFLDSFLHAVQDSGHNYKIILFTGKSAPTAEPVVFEDLPSFVFSVSSVSHAALFPLVDFIIHHGGAGTTAAALNSGTPSMVVSVFGDQPFWGKRTQELFGKGAPKTVPYKKIKNNGGALVKSIEKGLLLKERAVEIAEELQKEDGKHSAKEWLLNFLKKSTASVKASGKIDIEEEDEGVMVEA